MSNERIDMTQFEGHTEGPWLHCKSPVNGGEQFWSVVDHTQDTDVGDDTLGNWRIADIVDYEVDAKLLAAGPTLLAELERCYKQIDLLTKAFMIAGNAGCYMTICEECDDVHVYDDDECPLICEYCGEKKCECPASEEE